MTYTELQMPEYLFQNWIWLIYTANYTENNDVFAVDFILSPSVTYFRAGF